MLYRQDIYLKNIKIRTIETFINTLEERDPKQYSADLIKEIRIIENEPQNNNQVIYTRSSYGPFATERDSLV